MKKMNIMGIELRDYSLKEASRLIGQYLSNSRLDIVYFLSIDILVQAGESENLKKWLESMELTVPVSTEILAAAGITSKTRVKEVENNAFYKALIKRLSNERCTMFLLTETEAALQKSKEYIATHASGIEVIGSYAFENLSGDVDTIINDINSAVPDVVMSRLVSPKQEQFVYENRNKINSKIWLAINDTFTIKESSMGLKLEKLSRLIDKTIFRRMVSKYENNQEKGDS